MSQEKTPEPEKPRLLFMIPGDATDKEVDEIIEAEGLVPKKETKAK